MRINIEVTDTFGGQADYSWKRSYSFLVPDLLSNYSIIRRVKKYIQWSGERCIVTWYGGEMAGLAEIRRVNACMVAFVTVGENDGEGMAECADAANRRQQDMEGTAPRI